MQQKQNIPLISIPLCTFNGARYLSAQLDSLFAQSYSAVEIVAVDDCSTDATVSILNHYAGRHPNMRVVVNPANLGFLRNFELALSHCRGEFIAPCDQDDVWLPDKLDSLYRQMDGGSMCYCDSALMDADGKLLGKSMSDIWMMKNLYDPMSMVMENCVSGHAMLFRRGLLSRALPIPVGFFHDWWLAAVAAANGGVIYCPQVLVHYRQHAANVTDVLRTRKSRRDRKAISKLMKWRDTGDRIAALAELDGPSRVLLTQLDGLWRRRSEQWFCLSLVIFAFKYREILWRLLRASEWRLMRRPLRYLTGMRWLRLVGGSADPKVG